MFCSVVHLLLYIATVHPVCIISLDSRHILYFSFS